MPEASPRDRTGPLDDVAGGMALSGLLLSLFVSSSSSTGIMRSAIATLLLASAAVEALSAARSGRRCALLVDRRLAILLILIGCAAAAGPAIASSWERAVTWVAFISGGATLAATSRDGHRRSVVLAAFLTGATLCLLQGLAEPLYLFDQLRDEARRVAPELGEDSEFRAFFTSDRARSTFAQANGFAGFLLMFLPLALIITARQRIRGALLTAGLIAGLFAAGSRGGAWVAIVIAGITLREAGGSRGARRSGAALLIVAGFGAVLAILALLGLVESERLATLMLRREYWWTGLRMTWGSLPSGVGLGFFGECYASFSEPDAAYSRFAHNAPLTLMAECGLLGLAITWLGIRQLWPTPAPVVDVRPGAPRSSPVRGAAIALGVAIALSAIEPGLRWLGIHAPFIGADAMLAVALGGLILVCVAAPIATAMVKRGDELDRALRLGAFGFLLHSLVDFDLWIHGVLAALVVILALRRSHRIEPRPGSPLPSLVTAVCLCALALAWMPLAQRKSTLDRWMTGRGPDLGIERALPLSLGPPVHLEALYRMADRSPAKNASIAEAMRGLEDDFGHLPRFARRLARHRRD